MAENWYALQCKPNREDAVWQQVQTRRLEGYYPRVRVRTVNPRARQVHPYFPGYLFLNLDLSVVSPSDFTWMPHAVGLVCFGGEAAPVPDSVIEGVREAVGQIVAAGTQWYDHLTPGDPIGIKNGPLAGYHAVFDSRITGTERVRVLLEILCGRPVTVNLDAACLEPRGRA